MRLKTSSPFSARIPQVARFVALFLALTTGATLVRAQIFAEVGDAGQTPGTAQNSGLTTTSAFSQVTILGTIGGVTGGNANDADVFRLTIGSAGFYSFSTVNALTGASGGPGGLDTQLFLFNSAFQPVLANDDANGFTLQSNIPITLAPGVYYIGISLSGNDPVNSNNQLVFNSGLSTSLRGMASGINPTTWANFDNGASFAQTGAYQINIVNLPETGSTLVLALGAVGALFVVRRLVVRNSTAG